MSLSDKINKDINLLEKNDDLLKVKFVKVFIKELKNMKGTTAGEKIMIEFFKDKINKLAGEDLI